jgi:hypothetical protein
VLGGLIFDRLWLPLKGIYIEKACRYKLSYTISKFSHTKIGEYLRESEAIFRGLGEYVG